jgi:uncharacterized OB-fold protein
MSDLILTCPHCTYEHEDMFEVLDTDSLDAMRCEGCKEIFTFALMECHRCANEQAFSWRHPPLATALDQLTCEACGNTFRYPHAYQEDELL